MNITLVYLHGLASTGAGSAKAQELARIFPRQRLLTPDLPDRPFDAIAFLDDWLPSLTGPVALIGSSIGGYYAWHYGSRFHWPVALMNPLVDTRRLPLLIGEHQNFYTGASFVIDEDDIEALQGIKTKAEACHNALLLLDDADELLDARYALETWQGHGKILSFPGGNHRFAHLTEAAPMLRQHFDE
ncbi:MAG: YqiA/YcfP family alpha/beta fold hydrolase [Mariprofundaceae bacterium]|nr:YqiA/YcfP family alpha/beta fold hydrolase [Mariprofundaceae bacterium]